MTDELLPVKTKIVKRAKGDVRSITTKFKAPKPKKTAKKKVAKAKPAKAAAPKKPGVIDAIVEVLRASEDGISLVDLTAKIAKKFPQRDPAGLAKTCRAQLQRLPLPVKDGGRGIKVKKVTQEGTRVKLYLI
jgi:hypothetical protein